MLWGWLIVHSSIHPTLSCRRKMVSDKGQETRDMLCVVFFYKEALVLVCFLHFQYIFSFLYAFHLIIIYWVWILPNWFIIHFYVLGKKALFSPSPDVQCISCWLLCAAEHKRVFTVRATWEKYHHERRLRKKNLSEQTNKNLNRASGNWWWWWWCWNTWVQDEEDRRTAEPKALL